MKNQWIRTTALFAFAMIMVAGMNAQNTGGRGMGPCGQGQGPGGAVAGQGYGQGYGGTVAGQGYGQGYGRGAGLGYGQTDNAFGPRMQAILNLTEAQQEELSALRVKHFKVMNPLRAEMGELNARERTLMAQEEIDIKALHKVIDQQTDLSNTIQKKQLDNRIACRNILTEEQQVIFDQQRMYAGRMSARGDKGMYARHSGRGYRR